jgi:hypothetical protein
MNPSNIPQQGTHNIKYKDLSESYYELTGIHCRANSRPVLRADELQARLAYEELVRPPASSHPQYNTSSFIPTSQHSQSFRTWDSGIGPSHPYQNRSPGIQSGGGSGLSLSGTMSPVDTHSHSQFTNDQSHMDQELADDKRRRNTEASGKSLAHCHFGGFC